MIRVSPAKELNENNHSKCVPGWCVSPCLDGGLFIPAAPQEAIVHQFLLISVHFILSPSHLLRFSSFYHLNCDLFNNEAASHIPAYSQYDAIANTSVR